MTFTGTDGNINSNDVYDGYYFVTLNGITNTAVICDDYNNTSTLGVNVPVYISTDVQNALSEYNAGAANPENVSQFDSQTFAIAFIQQLLANGVTGAQLDDAHAATWHIGDTSVILDAGAQADYNFFMANAAEGALLTFVSISPTTARSGQSMEQVTPEPSTCFLLLFGIAGMFLGGGKHLRKRSASCPIPTSMTNT